MSLISDTQMERRCRTLAGAVPIPEPYTIQGLIQAVAALQGAEITSRPLPAHVPPEFSGFVIGSESADGGWVITHPQGDDTWSLLVTTHELGHILAGHVPPGVTVQSNAVSEARSITQQMEALIGGQLSAEMLKGFGRTQNTVRFRCSMSEPDEREAELIGTLLAHRVLRRATSRAVPESDVLTRYSVVLHSKPRRGRKDG